MRNLEKVYDIYHIYLFRGILDTLKYNIHRYIQVKGLSNDKIFTYHIIYHFNFDSERKSKKKKFILLLSLLVNFPI